MDPKCKNNVLNSNYACVMCGVGSYASGGTCFACPDPLCGLCRPDQVNVCMICMPGTYMNKDYVCVKFAETPLPAPGTSTGSTDTGTNTAGNGGSTDPGSATGSGKASGIEVSSGGALAVIFVLLVS